MRKLIIFFGLISFISGCDDGQRKINLNDDAETAYCYTEKNHHEDYGVVYSPPSWLQKYDYKSVKFSCYHYDDCNINSEIGEIIVETTRDSGRGKNEDAEKSDNKISETEYDVIFSDDLYVVFKERKTTSIVIQAKETDNADFDVGRCYYEENVRQFYRNSASLGQAFSCTFNYRKNRQTTVGFDSIVPLDGKDVLTESRNIIQHYDRQKKLVEDYLSSIECKK